MCLSKSPNFKINCKCQCFLYLVQTFDIGQSTYLTQSDSEYKGSHFWKFGRASSKTLKVIVGQDEKSFFPSRKSFFTLLPQDAYSMKKKKSLFRLSWYILILWSKKFPHKQKRFRVVKMKNRSFHREYRFSRCCHRTPIQ